MYNHAVKSYQEEHTNIKKTYKSIYLYIHLLAHLFIPIFLINVIANVLTVYVPLLMNMTTSGKVYCLDVVMFN